MSSLDRELEGHQPRIGEERYGEGDTFLVHNILPSCLANGAIESLRSEVAWNMMSHRGGNVPRLVAIECIIEQDGSIPLYRHPADYSPPPRQFTPTAEYIREYVSSFLHRRLNHALIQLYRSGGDYISEHSDKSIDIARGSCIVNVSLGAQRTMTLRTKKDSLSTDSTFDGKRVSQSIPLPHNSMLVMGLATNAKWLHSIRHDRRPDFTKLPEEVAWNSTRISLTFRHINTFLTGDLTRIWGQGATGKTKEEAHEVSKRDVDIQELIKEFGNENHQSNFDWEASYGGGFDVLHFN